MFCTVPRAIKISEESVDSFLSVTITGQGNANYVYVKINGVKYYQPAVVSVNSGTSCDIRVEVNSLYDIAYIYVNNKLVNYDLAEAGLQYLHTVTTNTTINISITDENVYFYITTT